MDPGWEVTRNAYRSVERPFVRLSVGLRQPHKNGPGELIIEQGKLMARPSGRFGGWFFGVGEIDHRYHVVNVNRSLLLPPWMNVRMMVFGRDEQIGVVLSWWDLARVQRTLTDHGFEVRVSRSSLPTNWSVLADEYRGDHPVDGSDS